jgi:hypothetical protein
MEQAGPPLRAPSEDAPKREWSTAGLSFAAAYVALVVCTIAYAFLYADSPTELLFLLILLHPWILVATPIVYFFDEANLPLFVICAFLNTVLVYRLGKKLSKL